MDNDRIDRSSPKRPLGDEELECCDQKMKNVATSSPNREGLSIPSGQAWDLEREIALLPNPETDAFRQALKRAPELVILESDPSAFLDFHKGDAKEATKRLSYYWKTRVEVFGDKAFLPLSFPQRYGLLSPEHWQELNCDTMVPLPADAAGNAVLFIDRSRQVCPPDLKIRLLRCCLLKSKNGSSGLALLFRASERATFCSPVDDHLFQWILEAFPVSLKHVRLIGCPPANLARRIFENGIMRSAVQTLKKRQAKALTAHVGVNKKDLLDTLMPCGFQKEGLPQVMGGNWDYQVFHAWVQGQHEGKSDEKEGRQESKTDVDDDAQENPPQERVQHPSIERQESSQPQGQVWRNNTPAELEDSKPSATNVAGIPSAQIAAPERGDSSSSSDDDDVEEEEEEEDRKLPARTMPLLEGRRTGLQEPTSLAQPMQQPHTVANIVESLLAMAPAANTLGASGIATTPDRQDVGSLQALQPNQQLQLEMAIARLTRDPRFNLYASAPATQFEREDAASARPEENLRPGTGQLLGLLSNSINARPAQTTQPTQDRILEPTSQALPVLPTGLLAQRAGSAAVSNAMNLLPVFSKKAYLEALQYCPRLVEIESDAQKFLKCTDYDVMAAAQRLASYWQYRKQLFGSRAFAPLIQSGNGALTSDDVVLLSSGAIATLPPDDSGCSVVCMDRSRLLGRQAATVNDRLRAAFYLASTLTEVDKNMTEGIVLICILVTPRVQEIDNEMTLGLLELGRTAFPIKVKHIHLNVCPPKTGKRATVDSMISSQLKLITGSFKGNASLHIAETPEAILEKLRPFGLREDALPPSVGGTWKYEEFNRFLRHQSEREQRLESTLLTMSAKPPAQSEKGEKVDKKERKRLLNIIHSRQKRERRRAEMERMSEERDALEAKNKHLRSANDKLENLIGEAEQMVEKIEKGEIIPVSTAARLPAYGASGSMARFPEQGLNTANQGPLAPIGTGISFPSTLEHSAGSERMIQPPRFDTARFSTLRQQPEQSCPFALEQNDSRLLTLQQHATPQDSQSELLAHLWGDRRARAVAADFPSGTHATALPSYQGHPESTMLRSAFISELEKLMQGASPAAQSQHADLQQLLLNQERASSQVSDAQLLELLLLQQQQQQARNQATVSSAGSSAFLPTSSHPQVPLPPQLLQSFSNRFTSWNHPSSGLHAPPVGAAAAAAAAPPPPALNVDPQVVAFLQALEQQRQQPPPPRDPTNHPY